MNELDHIWSRMLDVAADNAQASGKSDIADYLRLKMSNDAIRTASVTWLFDTVIEITGRAMRDHFGIIMEREEPHNFARGSSNMVGSLLEIRQGVRCLSIEAGWTRTPSDGIMQSGALAFARIHHFGLPRESAEIRLVHADDLPRWIDDDGAVFSTAELQSHVDLFLGG